jgi:hypothetical protein
MSKFRTRTIRRETSVVCQCFADPVLFLKWEDVPEEAKKEFEDNGGIPCGGEGFPGEWCSRCRFGEVLDPEDV